MPKIKGKEDLPDWFKLDEYELCKSFIAIDWVVALKKRRFILELLDCSDDYAMRFAEDIWRDPTDCFRFEWEYPESPVKPLTFCDLAHQGGTALLMAPTAPSEAENWANTINAIANGKWLSGPFNKEPVDNDRASSRILLVNLHATDSVLMEAFSAWVRDARLRSNVASKRELPAYRSWARHGLLPYLDLFIWSELTGNEISHHVMALVVGYSNGGDSFRKTVPKLRIEIAQHIAELEALAAIESRPEEFTP